MGGGNFAPKPTSLTSYKASLLRTCLGTQICLEMKFSLYKTNQILTQSLYSCGSISEFPQKKHEGKYEKGFMSSDRKYNQINKHRILLYIFNNVLGKQLYLL